MKVISSLSIGRCRRLETDCLQEPPRREADASATACAHTLSRAFTSLGSSPVNKTTRRRQYSYLK